MNDVAHWPPPIPVLPSDASEVIAAYDGLRQVARELIECDRQLREAIEETRCRCRCADPDHRDEP